MAFAYLFPALKSVPGVHETLTHLVESSHVDFDTLVTGFWPIAAVFSRLKLLVACSAGITTVILPR
jgi:hypothetical protein